MSDDKDSKPCYEGGNQHASIITREEVEEIGDGHGNVIGRSIITHRQCQSCGRNL